MEIYIVDKLKSLQELFDKDPEIEAVYLIKPVDVAINPDKKYIVYILLKENSSAGFFDNDDLTLKYKDFIQKESGYKDIETAILNSSPLAHQYTVVREATVVYYKSKEEIRKYEEQTVKKYLDGVKKLENEFNTEISDDPHEYVIIKPERDLKQLSKKIILLGLSAILITAVIFIISPILGLILFPFFVLLFFTRMLRNFLEGILMKSKKSETISKLYKK